MTRHPGQPLVVKQTIRDAKKALASRGLQQPLSTDIVRIDQVEHWRVSSKEIPVKIDKAVEGRWTLRMEWVFTPIPAGEPALWKSSVGLYVEGAMERASSKACLVRYDLDNQAPGHGILPLGAHLNVMQPEPLADKVHYPIPGVDDGGWAVKDILEILLSDRLWADLGRRLERAGSRTASP